MSGHSKWSTIKRKKGANDAKRGAIFTRIGREISVAAREGGGDPDVNFSLRLVIDKARAANMPKDNIERAIKRGTGESKDGLVLEQITYEGYGAHGIAMMIECVSDNRNRTVAEIRHLLSRYGGSLGENGSVAWQFTRVAYFLFQAEGRDEDEIFELAVDAGADDVVFEDSMIEITGPVDSFKEIGDRLRLQGIKPEDAELRQIPNTEIELDPQQTVQVLKAIEALEDLDDVQKVSSNLAISDEALELLAA